MQLKCGFIALVLCLGCASSQGFDRGRIDQQLNPEARQISDDDIRRVLQLRPQIRFPFKLAIYYPRFYGRGGNKDNLEGPAIQQVCDNLKSKGVVSACFFINEDTIPAEPASRNDYYYGRDWYGSAYPSLRSIRFAAARHGAEAVLTLRSAIDVRKYPNILSFFYITIIGMWVAPGSTREALYVYRGSIWDVGNEYLYATAEGEASDYIIRPLALAEEEVAIQKARELALPLFVRELEKRLLNLKGP